MVAKILKMTGLPKYLHKSESYSQDVEDMVLRTFYENKRKNIKAFMLMQAHITCSGYRYENNFTFMIFVFILLISSVSYPLPARQSVKVIYLSPNILLPILTIVLPSSIAMR